MKIGYFLSCEEHGPRSSSSRPGAPRQAGFQALWISDHFHPWIDEQGQSPFVWSVIGALARRPAAGRRPAVTCPTVRIHPAIIAQAAATSAVMLGGRFVLGVGTGEALNEHILGDPGRTRRAPGDARGGRRHHARALERRTSPPPRQALHGRERPHLHAARRAAAGLMSGFGPKAVDVAGADRRRLHHHHAGRGVDRTFRDAGGDGKPVQAGSKVC